MIKAFFLDTTALLAEYAEQIINDTPALAGVIDARSPERRRESEAGYILLLAVMRRLGISELPRVLRREGGKPYLEGCPISFSLSHRPGAALLAISDEGEVGADVEIMKDRCRIERVVERTLGKTEHIETKNLECELILCVMNERGEVKFLDDIAMYENHSLHIEQKNAADTPYLAWTLLEAALKVDGGGFADYARRAEIISSVSASHYEVRTSGDSYAVSVTADGQDIKMI